MAEAFNFYGASDDDLERWLMFSVAVAGKTADTTWKAINRFLNAPSAPAYMGPYEIVRHYKSQGALMGALRDSRIGKYDLLTRAYSKMVDDPIDPRTASLEQLETIPGVGPKTARMFIAYSRPKSQYAILDTHVLKWLRGLGYVTAPLATPRGGQYEQWENVFLKEAHRLGKNPVDLDYEIWLSYSRKGNGDQSQTHTVR